MNRLLLAALTIAVLSAKETPAWLHDAAKQTVRSDYPAKVHAVALLREEHLTVDVDGRRSMTERGAVKILQAGGPPPEAYRTYNPKTGRIRELRAWLLLPSGKEVEYDKKRMIDVALAQEYTYDEGRAKVMQCDGDAPAGSVFAWEVTEEEDTIFTTYPYDFQEEEPVVVARFILSLPAGWEARGHLFNYADVAPEISGGNYTWTLRDLPAIEQEDHGPGWQALAPRLALTYFAGSSAKADLRPLKDWPAVSGWLSGFVDPPAAVTPSVRAKAAELTASAKDDLERIRAIAKFTQQTNYVEVAMNLTRGGGYTPHPASDVLSRNYGDCKDKSALMRALLKAAGIDSYAVVIFSGDRDFVRREWPSPMQFNHAIVAVKVTAENTLPTVADYPPLGRLLIFDPTDPYTPVGDLPEEEQGSLALVIAGDRGDLLRMPRVQSTSNRIELAVEARMEPSGAVGAHLTSQYFGQSGAVYRYTSRSRGADQLKRMLEAVYARRLGGVTLDNVQLADHVADGKLDLTIDLKVREFGQLMQGKLLIVRPGALAPDNGYNLPKKERKLPLKLEARVRHDRIELQLPGGFVVDEMPDAVDIKSAYGTYQSSWKAMPDRIIFEQSLEIQDVLAPASEYPKVRDFFEKLSAGQYSPVLLTRK
jgi:transglutaminase-like putative cysteine protease